MRTRRPSRHGAAMSPARRLTGATCRGRHRRRRPVALKCRRRAGHRRLGATRQWARARVRWLPRPRGSADGSLPCGAQRMGASKPQRSAPRQVDPLRRSEERPASIRQLYDGSDRPDSDSLQRRRSRGRSSDSASTPSAPPVVGPSVAPRRLQSLLIRGGGAPDGHVSLVASGGHGPTPAVAEAGGTTLQRAGESVAAVEAAGRSGAAPEPACPKRAAPQPAGSKRAAPEQGSKRAASEQGSSYRPVKKARVRSKM
jgi:hypothetical protein